MTLAMVTASLLTGPTRAAVATIAVRGPGAVECLQQAFQTAGTGAIRPGQVRYGLWHGGTSSTVAESVVVSRNHDYLAGVVNCESLEVHCHGGTIAAERILDDLKRLGCEVVAAATWPDCRYSSHRRADALSGAAAPELLIDEAIDVLSRSVSVRAAAIALDQIRGAMVDFVDRSNRQLSIAAGEPEQTVQRIAEQARVMLRLGPLGLHLALPWRVVLAGPPNVGKSSLINALVGYRRSIILDMPGTTRDVLEAQTVIDGWPVRLSDTAGIRDEAPCAIEAAGIESARQEIELADLVVWVEDVSADGPSGWKPEPATNRPFIRVANKVDRLSLARRSAFGASGHDERKAVCCVETSAATGEGIETLRQSIAQSLVAELPEPAAPVPITARQIACLQQLAEAQSPESTRAALRRLEGVGIDH